MKKTWIVGIDEVGRGPLAGPVYVCGALMKTALHEKVQWKGLTDSKKMTAKARAAWFEKAKELKAAGKIDFIIASRTAGAIDARGIAVVIRECITEILEKLDSDPKRTLIELDGSLFAPTHYVHQQTFIKGDLHRKIISLASVIAKVSRDRYMINLHKKHPIYGWDQNKGYGTHLHRKGIQAYGATSFHRKTFLTKILTK